MIFSSEAGKVDGTLKFVESVISANDASDYCRAVVHSVLGSDQACAAQLFSLSSAATLSQVGSYGYRRDDSQAREISIWGNSLVATAIRTSQPVVCKDKAERRKLASDFEILSDQGEGIVVVPITNGIEPIGCFSIEFMGPIDGSFSDPLAVSILKSFGQLALEKFTSERSNFRNNAQNVMTMTPEQIIASLTERQRKVLSYIANDYTNFRIGRALSLSESAIKQETIKIYKKLGVKTRKEAARLAGEFGLIA